MNSSSNSSGEIPWTRDIPGVIRPEVTSATNEPDSAQQTGILGTSTPTDSARGVATQLVYPTSDRRQPGGQATQGTRPIHNPHGNDEVPVDYKEDLTDFMSTSDGVDFDGTNPPRVANPTANATERADRHRTHEMSTSDSLVRTESPARKRSRAGPQASHSDDENRQDAILRLRLLRSTAVLCVVAETARTRELVELELQETGTNRGKLLQEIGESYEWYQPSDIPPELHASGEGNPSDKPQLGGTPVDNEPATLQILRIINANIIRLDGDRPIHGLRDEDFEAWIES